MNGPAGQEAAGPRRGMNRVTAGRRLSGGRRPIPGGLEPSSTADEPERGGQVLRAGSCRPRDPAGAEAQT